MQGDHGITDAFSDDDRHRLARSSAWRAAPARIERLCRLLAQVDPMGCCYFGMNPKAWTEYLVEAEALNDGLDACRSPAEVKSLLERVFAHYFEACWTEFDWSKLVSPLELIRDMDGESTHPAPPQLS